MEWCLVFRFELTKEYSYVIEFSKANMAEASKFAEILRQEVIAPMCKKYKTDISKRKLIKKTELPLFLKQNT